jgi:hypothetical protein
MSHIIHPLTATSLAENLVTFKDDFAPLSYREAHKFNKAMALWIVAVHVCVHHFLQHIRSLAIKCHLFTIPKCNVGYPYHFDADPDSVCHFDEDPDADPDPTFHIDADPDPTFHIDADPDPTFQFGIRIWIQLITLMQLIILLRMWIQIRIQILPFDPFESGSTTLPTCIQAQ